MNVQFERAIKLLEAKNNDNDVDNAVDLPDDKIIHTLLQTDFKSDILMFDDRDMYRLNIEEGTITVAKGMHI
jgi:hypothetical protein